jgi:hypothetical protein
MVMAAPIPFAGPVMTATLPLSIKSIVTSSLSRDLGALPSPLWGGEQIEFVARLIHWNPLQR